MIWGPPCGEPLFFSTRQRLVFGVIFDDQVRFHHNWIRHIAQRRGAHELDDQFLLVNFQIVWNIAFGQRDGFHDQGHLARLFTHGDDIAFFHAVGRDVLSGQCGRLKCCLNYELETYMDALKDIPTIEKPLQTIKGDAFLQKTDIFKRVMWFGYRGEESNWIPITVDRVQEVLALNAKGEKPQTIDGAESAKIELELEKGSGPLNADLDKMDRKYGGGGKKKFEKPKFDRPDFKQDRKEFVRPERKDFKKDIRPERKDFKADEKTQNPTEKPVNQGNNQNQQGQNRNPNQRPPQGQRPQGNNQKPPLQNPPSNVEGQPPKQQPQRPQGNQKPQQPRPQGNSEGQVQQPRPQGQGNVEGQTQQPKPQGQGNNNNRNKNRNRPPRPSNPNPPKAE